MGEAPTQLQELLNPRLNRFGLGTQAVWRFGKRVRVSSHTRNSTKVTTVTVDWDW